MNSKIVLCAALFMAASLLGVAHAEEKSVYDAVKERGVLRAGIKADAPPFGFVNEKGEHVGFEVDLIKEIARRLGVKLDIQKVTSSTRIPMLTSNRVDIVAATMTHYRKREEVVDFSIGYMKGPMTLLVRKGSPVKSIADMKGRIAGFGVGSAALKEFQRIQPNAQYKTFQGVPETFLALQQGLIDAMPTDIIILAGLKANVSNPANFELLGKDSHFADGEYGLGVPRNDSKWRNNVNYLLQDIWLDGTWDKIFDKWIGTPLKLNKNDLGFEMIVWEP
ncbi:MAG TPA: transporter substrate-binding domain-containing protein [Burkholderiales bacterium]|nr:transporter substrate-binding domain-containing protein [Burkholderiales bacterium]